MPCESCRRYQQRQLEKRREIQQRKRERLAEACAQGDQRSCRTLQQMDRCRSTGKTITTAPRCTGALDEQ